MNIALIGSGGREHALCEKIHQSKITKNVFCIPGNAGTAKIAKNIEVDFLDFKTLLVVLKKYKMILMNNIYCHTGIFQNHNLHFSLSKRNFRYEDASTFNKINAWSGFSF